ncbi:MAG: ATP-binding protein [bacterium]|nr:ATP-binding protein [bacterium]
MNSIKKIAIVGPESSGKTTLAQQLAQELGDPWVEEYAREYLNNLGRPYDESDLVEIAKGQVDSERNSASKASKYVICDTDMVVIRIWSLEKFGDISGSLEIQMNSEIPADIYLLTDPNIPWEYDPLRENPYDRQYLFDQYKFYLRNGGFRFKIISGSKEDRLQLALEAVKYMDSL